MTPARTGGPAAVEVVPPRTDAIRVLGLDGGASAEALFRQFCAWYREQVRDDARDGPLRPDHARLQRVVLLCHIEQVCRTAAEALRELRMLALRPNGLGAAAGELAAILEGLSAMSP
jgi:hypothetical protein